MTDRPQPRAQTVIDLQCQVSDLGPVPPCWVSHFPGRAGTSGPSCRNFILDLNKGVNALGVLLQRRPRPRPSGASVAAFPAHTPGTAILLVYGQHVSAGFQDCGRGDPRRQENPGNGAYCAYKTPLRVLQPGLQASFFVRCRVRRPQLNRAQNQPVPRPLLVLPPGWKQRSWTSLGSGASS